jgi:hypothetical protein
VGGGGLGAVCHTGVLGVVLLYSCHVVQQWGAFWHTWVPPVCCSHTSDV